MRRFTNLMGSTSTKCPTAAHCSLTWETVNASKEEVVKYRVHYRNSSSEWKQFETTWLAFDLPLEDEIVEARVRAFHMLCNIRDSKILGEMSNTTVIKEKGSPWLLFMEHLDHICFNSWSYHSDGNCNSVYNNTATQVQQIIAEY
ncbi:unnamed protein product, partial [Rodentolepis nana]|uniref:Tudor-knot domain-containing protein n=1 Tax=Rodentolepis nana TaxID=102285 RepID=A0A0R3TCQ6_RODNA